MSKQSIADIKYLHYNEKGQVSGSYYYFRGWNENEEILDISDKQGMK